MSTHLYKDWQYAIQSRMNLEVSRPFNVFLQLIKTNGWIYPIKGFIFFWENYQKLLPIFLSVVLPYTVLHFYVYTILIFAILPINLVICTLTTGPIGVQIAVFQSFQQCSCLNSYIFKNYLIKGKLNKVFDTTLCINGLDRIVIPGKLKRLVSQTLGAQLMEINMINLIIFLSSSIYSICISSIPILGTISIYYNTAIKTAELSQQRMWQLTRQRPRQVRYHIKENEGEFLMFGITCQILESLPVLGLLFCFTNHVGAALLATDIYKRSTGRG
jgi:hypothetical protein